MKRFKRNLLRVLMLWWLLPASGALGQQAMIRGHVYDNSGTPVEGATISVVENLDAKATSDKDGWFAISAQIGQHLQVNIADESGKTIPISQNNMTINLQQDGRGIPIGYGRTRSPDELTAAVGVVGTEALTEAEVINPENALYGKVPGLTVLQNGGSPPNGTNMYIRGRETFTNSNPLVLIDGFERPLSTLSVDEIESVTVLKDAASLAIYGQRGANGVLLVTTKRGQEGGLNVTTSFTQAVMQPVGLPSFLEAPAYARAINEAHANDGKNPRYSQADIEAFDSGNSPYLHPNVDWFDEVLRSRGTRSNFNVTFEGGGETVRYFALMNHAYDYGIFGPVNRNKDYSTQNMYGRFNFRSNLDIDITDELLLKINVGANLVDNNLPGGGGGTSRIFDGLYSIPSAAFPVKTPDGSWGGTQIYDNNPVAMLTSTGYGSPNSRELFVDGSIRKDLSQWVNGLSAEAAVSYNNYSIFFEQKDKSYSYQSLSPVWDNAGNIVDTTITTYGQDTDLNFLSNFGTQRTQSNILGKLDYLKPLGGNTLKATVLFHQDARILDGQDNTFRRRNFAASAHYNVANKYFFEAAISYSGNNLLPKGDRYGFFPAVSAGWLLSEEDFLQDVGFLDLLKLRASWGISGSDWLPTNNPHEQAYQGASGYWFQRGNNFQGGFAEGRLATSDFTFETSYKTNLGIDANLFGKLDMSADLFYARRTNILTGTRGRVSQIIGITPALETDGIVENKGLEAALNWQDNLGEVVYQLGGQISFTRNKIVEMNEQFRPYDYQRRTGRLVGQWFGLQAVGFFEDQADIENSPLQVFSQVQPGDIKYKDQNGDGIINEFDEVPLGYSAGYPSIYFSVSLGVSYKGFGISALFQGTGNHTAYLNTKSVFWPLRNNSTISDYYYSRRWTPQTSGSASFPRLTTESNDNNFRPNSIWLADQSYVKLRTLEISYDLPASVTQPWKINKVRIIARGMNLFSIDSIPVLDPENISTRYPILRSFNAGLEIAF